MPIRATPVDPFRPSFASPLAKPARSMATDIVQHRFSRSLGGYSATWRPSREAMLRNQVSAAAGIHQDLLTATGCVISLGSLHIEAREFRHEKTHRTLSDRRNTGARRHGGGLQGHRSES